MHDPDQIYFNCYQENRRKWLEELKWNRYHTSINRIFSMIFLFMFYYGVVLYAVDFESMLPEGKIFGTVLLVFVVGAVSLSGVVVTLSFIVIDIIPLFIRWLLGD